MTFFTIYDIVAVTFGFLAGNLVRRYFIITEAERKTNIPFLPRFNLITGSKDIVFCNDKVMPINANDWHHKLGDTIGCFFGQNMQLWTRDADLIYEILVKDFQRHHNRSFVDSLSKYMRASLLEARDKAWQNSRRAIGSVLKPSKLKVDNVEQEIDNNVLKMTQAIDRRLENFKAAKEEPIIDVFQVNKNFVMQSILKVIFDTHDLVDFNKEENEIVEDMDVFVKVNYEFVARMCFLIPVLTDFVRPILSFFDHGKFMNKLTAKLDAIVERISRGMEEGTLRSAVNQKYDPDNHGSNHTTIHSMVNSYRQGEMDRQQLIGNSFFLMMAGYATSVDLMSVFLWLMAQHQDIQDKLRTELKAYGETSSYLEQCLNETLRLYPGATTNREVTEHVLHKDMRLVKGIILNVNVYGVHHNPKYWGPDVEEWKPDRFNQENIKKFHPAQFIPFGIGPRNCVGFHFAKLELVKLSAQLILRYKFNVCESTQDEIRRLPLGALPFALPVEGPVYLRVTKV